MKNKRMSYYAFLLLCIGLAAACSKDNALVDQTNQADPTLKGANINHPVKVSVLVSDLVNPRELKFGPDGDLYVALAGTGGTNLTNCEQVITPIGPYLGGYTGSIIKINSQGKVSTVIDHLPSALGAGGAALGPADVAFVGDQLYALLDAGCSHGNSDVPSSVIKVDQLNSNWSVVADLSTFFQNNPTAVHETDDFEPDGTPYSMINVRGDFYVVEPNHCELDKVTTDGKIKRVIDFSAKYGHIVPTVVTFHDGNFYVSNLGKFPLVGGSSNVYKVTPGGQSKIFATGFTGVLGIAFDKDKRLYVLETSQDGGPAPMNGRVVRVNKDNSRDIVVDQLFFPTGMTFGPDGALYISNTGFGPPLGQILKVTGLSSDNRHDHPEHGENN